MVFILKGFALVRRGLIASRYAYLRLSWVVCLFAIIADTWWRYDMISHNANAGCYPSRWVFTLPFMTTVVLYSVCAGVFYAGMFRLWFLRIVIFLFFWMLVPYHSIISAQLCYQSPELRGCDFYNVMWDVGVLPMAMVVGLGAIFSFFSGIGLGLFRLAQIGRRRLRQILRRGQ